MFRPPVSQQKVRCILTAYLNKKIDNPRVKPLRGGFHNTLLKIDLPGYEPMVLQVAPLEKNITLWHERHMLKNVAAVHPFLKQKKIPVPELLFQDFSGKVAKNYYLIWEFMPGKNWFYANKQLGFKQQNQIYEILGSYTRKIHAIRGESGFGFPHSKRKFSSWSAFLLRYSIELNRSAIQMGLLDPQDIRTPLQLVKQNRDVLDAITIPRLIHGDLWLRNILIHSTGSTASIQSILDLERAVWGDPWFEWILYGLPLPKPFWQGYGKSKPQSSAGKRRLLCYHAMGLWQAAIEEALYFNRQGKARRWMKEVRGLVIG